MFYSKFHNDIRIFKKWFVTLGSSGEGLMITVVFQGVRVQRKSSNADEHGHGQDKRRPSTYVERTIQSGRYLPPPSALGALLGQVTISRSILLKVNKTKTVSA